MRDKEALELAQRRASNRSMVVSDAMMLAPWACSHGSCAVAMVLRATTTTNVVLLFVDLLTAIDLGSIGQVVE